MLNNLYQVLSIESKMSLLRTSADPEGETGCPDPPWKITSYMGFYRE